jgi:predicted ATPase
LFIIVNLLNTRLDMVAEYPNDADRTEIISSKRFQIAELNRSAGSKAISCSAFRAAQKHFTSAIQMLPTNHWRAHYDMSLEMFTSVTECAFVNHDHDSMYHFGTVVTNLDCPMLDKMRVYHVLMDASLGGCEHEMAPDATILGREVLAKFGLKFPTNEALQTLAIGWGLLKINSRLRAWTPQTMDALSESNDPQEQAVAKALDKLTTAAYLADPDFMPLVLIKSVERTFSNGLTLYSPVAFSILGLILGSVLGHLEKGRTCANHALSMLDKMDDRASECRVRFVCYAFVLQMTQLMEVCKEPLLNSYTAGMAMGDVESAVSCCGLKRPGWSDVSL